MYDIKLDESIVTGIAFAYFVFCRSLDLEREDITDKQAVHLKKRFLSEYLIEHSSGGSEIGIDNYKEIVMDDLKVLLS